MKLYTLNNTADKVIAVSEDLYYIELFKAQRYLTDKTYINVFKGDKFNEKIIVHEDVLLYEYDNMIVTALEMRTVETAIKEGKYQISDTALELIFMLKNYRFKPDEKAILIEALKLLRKISKKKRLIPLLGIKDFIFEIVHNLDFNITSMYNWLKIK